MKIRYLGDSALVLFYEGAESERDIRQLQRDYYSLREQAPDGISDIVLCYNSIGVYYNPQMITPDNVVQYIRARLAGGTKKTGKPNIISIPVYYGGRYGPDLSKLAEYLNMTEEEIIRYHSQKTYTVWGIGFLPGFPYMGKLPPELVVPRKTTPAPKVAAGSVAVAGFQTGIYPFDSPGGWHVIGWTPFKMFDLERPELCLLKPGDKVNFTVAEQHTK